ncbi:MAG: peptidoglycan-binding domain-containing protein [Candidatus Paceibacterota bacterium]|jgi:peptidoglycan hydrolase-like protein with peptidoglycan-binding domain|nr:peptidoglycan-binding domain-containing protein [Candidatus Paceibacterota bacterium]MDD3548655.1 peptidoglycan-binding domain-containing protein [Candidatus Paceibacterota bacterium]MDD4999123.1 peptidoglycan-binding domain-containing protein [Candidatus Paceibacterota bacterium]MDD5545509.1 peptidoglycan-binding domain-containing protein [Candidatus Paceibacterota bacterium]
MFKFKKLTIGLVLGLLILPSFSLASWEPTANFFVDVNYDLNARNQIEAQLIKTTNRIYFYADKNWYNNFSDKSNLDSKIYNLANDFEYKIYPTLVNLLGFEDKPGVDNDSRIIIVLEPLKDNYGGYIQSRDNYSKTIDKNSNEGQIIYLNANFITQADLNFLDYELAHEFTHLITLKQKPEADIWFYELMSEFAGQAIGVDTSRITKQRAQNLLYSTEVNLKDWKNSDKDYGKVYLFALYLREQFGIQLFSEALKYPSKDGMISFNEALKKRGTNFEEVYLNWLIANMVNDCLVDIKYCYQDSNLKNYSVIAYSYYLPMQAKSSLSVTDSIKPLTGKWQKLNGGLGAVKLKFSIPEQTPIAKIPYIIEDSQGKKTLGFFDFSATNIKEVYVNDLGTKNAAIYFIPYLGTGAQEGKLYFYSFEAQNLGNDAQAEQQIILRLTQQIEELKRQVAQLQLQLAMIKTNQEYANCSFFSADLYYGMTSPEVKCLQQFLANLGNDIYPEKLITGYYGPLTMAAVKRYQALQGIMTTGYFGPLTRAKVNQGL